MSALRNNLVDEKIIFRVSRLMVNEMTAAGIWAKLRWPMLDESADGSSLCKATIPCAREAAELCRIERERPGLRHGLKKAFSHVITNIQQAITDYERQGALDDPGMAEMLLAAREQPQQFKVNDRGFCCSLGEHVVVTGAYQMWKSLNPDGAYIDKEGNRFNYRFGYRARTSQDRACFVRAGDLLDSDWRTRHLVLVRSYGEPVVKKVTP
jgi:hypothetical protein